MLPRLQGERGWQRGELLASGVGWRRGGRACPAKNLAMMPAGGQVASASSVRGLMRAPRALAGLRADEAPLRGASAPEPSKPPGGWGPGGHCRRRGR